MTKRSFMIRVAIFGGLAVAGEIVLVNEPLLPLTATKIVASSLAIISLCVLLYTVLSVENVKEEK